MSTSLQYISPRVPGIEALICANSFAFGSHIHNGHVLWLNSEGGERYTLHGSVSILQPGSLSIIEPGVVHSNSPIDPGRRTLRSLYLGEEFFSYLEKMLTGDVGGRFNLPTGVIENQGCWQKAIFLHQAIVGGRDQLYIDELIVSLFTRILAKDSGRVNRREKSDSVNTRLKKVIECMRTRLDEDLSLDTLAQIAGCTSYYVIRLFKKRVGMSPHAYLVQLRLEKARELIDNGNSPADAAFLTGFSDQSHLTRKFKKRYGITPGVYRGQKLSARL